LRGNTINILIGGEAGQGLVTINDILCKSLVRHGYHIHVTQDYMSRVRGGHNTFHIRAGVFEVLAHEESIDLLVALNKETAELHQKELHEKAVIVADKDLGIVNEKCLQTPYKEMTSKKFHNIAGLGVLASLLGLDIDIVTQTVKDRFFGKGDEILAKNEETLEKAYAWADANYDFSYLKLENVKSVKGRMTIHGNHAIALGALSSGVQFYSFYPMTPSTTVGVTLASVMKKLPIVVEQAEDEIAAINMSIGASYAGAVSMVGTSGGGFALMTEAVSLAGITETPLVIVVAQRPGPATGLATRTEQADLDLVLNAGHGEFPRAIFAPGSVEQCFHLTRQAFDLAEASQCQIFILTDQYLSDCYQAAGPFDIDDMGPVKAGDDPQSVKIPYQRFELTRTGISPRLIPGKSEHLVKVDSHEHTESGHYSEDMELRKNMMDKRMRKMKLLEATVTAPEYIGDDNPDLLLVGWGSSRGAIFEAVSILNEKEKRTGALHFSQVWPLAPDQFMDYLAGAPDIVCVEGNAQGQLARLIRRETGFKINRSIKKYDGRLITPEYILRELGLE
jgi:2-oxoglutarate/2-oxoacid ferredoxin oxidoreductase subunit alpha